MHAKGMDSGKGEKKERERESALMVSREGSAPVPAFEKSIQRRGIERREGVLTNWSGRSVYTRTKKNEKEAPKQTEGQLSLFPFSFFSSSSSSSLFLYSRTP